MYIWQLPKCTVTWVKPMDGAGFKILVNIVLSRTLYHVVTMILGTQTSECPEITRNKYVSDFS